MFRRFFILVFLLLIGGGITLHPQSSVTDKTDYTDHSRLEMNGLKQFVLDSVRGEIDRDTPYLTDKDRSVFLAEAADVIWDYDREKARDLLRTSYGAADKADTVLSDEESKRFAAIKTDELRRKLKTEVLRVAQKRDLALVVELLDTFEKEDDVDVLTAQHNSPGLFGSSSFKRRQIALLAAAIATSDPKSSVKYAVSSFRYGVPYEINQVFRNLASINVSYSHEVFLKGVDYFMSDDSVNLYDAIILSGYVGTVPTSETDKDLIQQLLKRAFVREQLLLQQQAENPDPVVLNIILATTKELNKLYLNYLPENAGEIDIFLRQLSLRLSKPADFIDQIRADNASIDDGEVLLEKAEKETDTENKNAYYFEAALAFQAQAEYKKAVDAANKSTNESVRHSILNFILQSQALHLIKTRSLVDAAKVMDQIDDPEMRALIAISYAEQAVKMNNKPAAIEMINSTQGWLEKSFTSIPATRADIWLSSTYASVDPAVGFSLISSAIKKVNKTKDFVDFEPVSRLVRLGGKSNQAIMVGNSLGDFRPGFGILAKKNPMETLSLAQDFDNKFFRGMAVIASASAILKDLQNKGTESKKRGSKSGGNEPSVLQP
ncbi:MAG: hypothetical protein ABI878_07165 [Acidobacteriota bacterium]